MFLSSLRTKRIRKETLYLFMRAMYWAGLSNCYIRVFRVRGTAILAYHSVARTVDAQWVDPNNLTTENVFKWQMKFLCRRRHVVPMSTLVSAIVQGRSLEAGTVVITFDDGYRNVLDVAAPILAHYRLPSLLYLSTAYVGQRRAMWIDDLYTIFRWRTRQLLELDDPNLRKLDLRNNAMRAEGYRILADRLIVSDAQERNLILEQAAAQLQPHARPPRLMLTWDEVRELRDRYPLFEFGAHTSDHLDLALHARKARGQIEQSITDIERELGLRPAHFSFPYGRTSEGSRQAVMDSGLLSAVVGAREDLITEKSDPFALPRITVPPSRTLFRFQTGGAYPGLPKALVGRS
jgi:peptidoglycan/xylan/chitin deacetylase (PgdA/CDA1 family)